MIEGTKIPKRTVYVLIGKPKRKGMPNVKRGHKRPRYSRDWSGPVARVLEEYVLACHYEPIGSFSRLNRDGDSKPRVSPYRMVEFKCDCERAFSVALDYSPHLVPALQSILKELADLPFEPVSAGDKVGTIQKLGPVLKRFGLMPWTYFSKVRP